MLPEIDVIPRRDPALICEDTFDGGLNGWTQLLDGITGTGPVCLDNEITHQGSKFSMLLMTDDYSYNGNKPWGSSVAIKRLSRGPSGGKIYAEWWFAYGSLRATATSDTPRNIDFGIDQAAPDGTRRFFKLRWQNWDELAAPAKIVSEMRLSVSGGTPFVTIPGGSATVNLGVNENKRNLYHVELVVDLDAGVYDGARVNGTGWGSLASTPDTTLRAFGPPSGVLSQFASGLNAAVELCNRTDTNSTKCWANVAYFRMVKV